MHPAAAADPPGLIMAFQREKPPASVQGAQPGFIESALASYQQGSEWRAVD
jgi:hypothetical protein